MIVLAFDQANVTGWAVIDGGEVREFGVLDYRGLAPGERSATFLLHIQDLIYHYQPTFVAYERPGYHKNLAAAAVANGMVAIIEMAAHQAGLLCVQAQINAVKKRATGAGNAKKPEMVQAALKMESVSQRVAAASVQDAKLRQLTPDEADAIWIGIWAGENVETENKS